MKLSIRSARALILIVGVAVGLVASREAIAQTATAGSLLGQISAAFSNGAPIGSVQLSGRVERHTGSSTDSGTITLSGSADGSTQIQMNLLAGLRTESQTAIGITRSCQWSGPDGVNHDSSGPNCWPALVWFLPQMSVQPAKLSPLLSATDGGIETTTAGAFHVLRSQLVATSFSKSNSVVSQIQAHSMSLLFLDPVSMLPKLLDYTVHSDSGSAVISVEVRYSNYQRLAGLMIPTHIERRLNGGLEYAIDIAQASVLN